MKFAKKTGILVLLCSILNVANSQEFRFVSSQESGIDFRNQVKVDRELNFLIYETVYNGGGVAIGDINNDDLPDLYFSGNQVSDRLYLNLGNLKFRDITQSAGIKDKGGWSTGVTMVDINQDGFLDIYVCKSLYDDYPELRTNELYVNNGDGTFSEQAAKFGLNSAWRSQQAVFMDYDKDGDEDLFLVNQPPNPGMLSPLQGNDWLDPMFGCRLYRNDNLKFVDITKEAGVANRGYSLNAVVSDFNNDGWLDIYVSNDYDGPDFLYVNQQNGKFKDEILDAMGHISFYSMGSDAADFNNDGKFDIVALDMVAEDNYRLKANMSGMNPEEFWALANAGGHYQYMYNTLQLNQGTDQNSEIKFSDIGQLAGMSSTDWSWSPLMADFNNDGWKDIFISNGMRFDTRFTDALKKSEVYFKEVAEKYGKANNGDMSGFDLYKSIDYKYVESFLPSTPLRNYMYINNGDYGLQNIAGTQGLEEKTFTTGAAYGDLDLDGDLDLVMNNLDELAYIYENKIVQDNSHYLRVNLFRNNLVDSRAGIVVKVKTGDITQTNLTHATRGFYSSSENILHFGLGTSKKVDHVEVIWPDGKTYKTKDIKGDQVLRIDYEKAKRESASLALNKTIYSEKKIVGLDFVHKENEFDDFEREVLLPHKLSALGPALTKGDVNGDGLEDIYVGGALGQSGSLYMQGQNGSFSRISSDSFNQDIKSEDIDAVFFDADSDNDLDLYVVSGGNEKKIGSADYMDRLYINDGKGNYTKSIGLIPSLTESGGVVSIADYDKDGDSDIFVGGRLIPGRYPEPASSYILKNQMSESGKLSFKNVTDQVSPDLRNIGMVTDAVWTDLNVDGRLDLMVVGMWMKPTILVQNNGKFERAKSELDNLVGWWSSIDQYDLDGDGDKDFVLGNLGLNYKYKATEDSPFSVHYKDFDGNGKNDIVLSYYNYGEEYPLRGRSCSSQQIPTLASTFPTYDSFASSNLEEVYGLSNLDKALIYRATQFESLLIENKGGLSFKPHKLPTEFQFTNVNDTWVGDIDNDGVPEIIGVGNMFGSEVETPRNDAGLGILLKGVEAFKYQAVPASKSGIFLNNQIKSVIQLKIGGKTSFVFGVNDGQLRVLDKN